MRCKHCNTKLADHDIWCVICGRQSSVPKIELSALNSMSETWKSVKKKKNEFIPSAAFAILTGLIPISILIVLFLNLTISFGNSHTANYLLNIALRIVAFSFVMPLTLLAFEQISSDDAYRLNLRDMIRDLKAYPKYFSLSLLTTTLYALFYVVCFGLPSFASDPILRLVWIVLVNYTAAVLLPVPVVMIARKKSAFAAVRLSFMHFHDLRWNIFLMALILIVINFLAFVFFLVGLLITLPFTWFCVRDYTRKLIDYELLEYRR